MRCRWKTWIAAIVITAALLLFVVFFRLNLTAPPPSVSITLLGYTNRVGPHAMLAITNQIPSAYWLATRIQRLAPDHHRMARLPGLDSLVTLILTINIR